MEKPLVIVESPAKARTIEKYLGGKYVVKSSVGHIRDLPGRRFGIEYGKILATFHGGTPTDFINVDKRVLLENSRKRSQNQGVCELVHEKPRR